MQFGEDALENAGRERTIGKSCVRVSCPDIRASEATNAQMLIPPGKEYFLSGDVVQVLCHVYHTIENSDTLESERNLTCLNSGQWSAEVPVCLRRKNN